jgi:hypothetical protein
VCVSGALLNIGPHWFLTLVFGWITFFNIWSLVKSL